MKIHESHIMRYSDSSWHDVVCSKCNLAETHPWIGEPCGTKVLDNTLELAYIIDIQDCPPPIRVACTDYILDHWSHAESKFYMVEENRPPVLEQYLRVYNPGDYPVYINYWW